MSSVRCIPSIRQNPSSQVLWPIPLSKTPPKNLKPCWWSKRSHPAAPLWSWGTSRNALRIARPTMQGFYMWECVNIKKSQWMTPEIPAFRFGSRLEIEYRDMAVMLSWPLITPWWSRLHEQTTPPAGVDQHTRAWCPACSEQATAATWWVLKLININYRKHICSLSVWFCGCSSSPVNCMGRMQQALRAYSAAWQPCRVMTFAGGGMQDGGGTVSWCTWFMDRYVH